MLPVAMLLRSKENRDELRLLWSSGKSVQCTTLWTLSLPRVIRMGQSFQCGGVLLEVWVKIKMLAS